jgi:hypothetical protein
MSRTVSVTLSLVHGEAVILQGKDRNIFGAFSAGARTASILECTRHHGKNAIMMRLGAPDASSFPFFLVLAEFFGIIGIEKSRDFQTEPTACIVPHSRRSVQGRASGQAMLSRCSNVYN